MAELARRRYGHSEGTTHLCFDSKRQLVTCGHDSDVRIFPSIIEDDDCTEFSVPSSTVSSLVCYRDPQGTDVVAVATENTVQAYQLDGTPEGLLLRFVGHVTYLAVNNDHTHLAAGSTEFLIKSVELKDPAKVTTFTGHEAPVLCVKFDPQGEYLASSSCDGSVKIWSCKKKTCVHTLAVLPKSNDVTLTKSLCYLSWQPTSGKMLAVPVGSEVKVYNRQTWNPAHILTNSHHHETLNVVSWSPCGNHLASGGVDGSLVLWTVGSQTPYQKLNNENKIAFTALEWDPRGRGRSDPEGDCLVFADKEGSVGAYQGVYPTRKEMFEDFDSKALENNDPLIDDSLLMEGIPADDIFNDDFDIDDDDDVIHTGHHGNDKLLDDDVDVEDDDIIQQTRKRRRLEIEEDDPLITTSNHDDEHSNLSSAMGVPLPMATDDIIVPPPPIRRGVEFSEKMIEKFQPSFQPSATPDHLDHRFLVYNLVGMVRSHSNEDAAMIEVEFHNTSVHHAFSLANHHGYSLAALNEQALVLASERDAEQSSILHCVHFSSWETNKDWTLSLPSKESTQSVAIGNGWIAIATSKRMIRMFTTGGVQRDLLSVPGRIVTLAGWGGRLAIVYQNNGPCTDNLFDLSVWVLDVCRRKQLRPSRTLPLSYRAKLEWIGFSEAGLLISYDTRGMVRILSDGCYGGLSWIPSLDTTKQLGNKSDHYFIVGMTHDPLQLRAILCKGMDYPPVHPKPVMNTLALKLPLCGDRDTEQIQLEDSYLQSCLLSHSEDDTTERVQLLMKQFALSCKAGHEFRAWEIAGMMPDEHSMNLALTYASRTQHVRLARHISELIQQKTSNDYFEDAYSDTHSDDWTNQISDEEEGSSDATYAQSRSEALKRGPQLAIPSTRKYNSLGKKYSKGNSLNRPAKDSRSQTGSEFAENGTVGVANDGYHDDVCDETKELFSGGSDGEEEKQGAELDDDNDDDVMDIGGATNDGEFPTRSSTMTSPLASSIGNEGKRKNPFKIATPVNKKIQLDRKSTFLDNISSKVDEEQKRKEVRKERGMNSGGRTKGPGSRKTGKTGSKKQVSNQGSLKSSFFKKKGVATTTSHDSKSLPSVNERSSPTNDSTVVTNGNGTAKDDHTTDQEEPVVRHDDSGVTNGSKMNSKEKLASFAFTPKET